MSEHCVAPLLFICPFPHLFIQTRVATDILSDWQIVIVLMMNSVHPAGTVIDVPLLFASLAEHP